MPFRETFWNIPHWAETAQYFLALFTAIVFMYGVIRRIRRWRQGRPEKRTGYFWKRIWSLVTQVLAQRRTLDEFYPGLMHFSIFWGMLVLAVGTALATIDWDVTHLLFGFQILNGTVYVVFELALDLLGLLVVLGLGMAVYRRYVTKPSRLGNFPAKGFERDDTYALVMLSFITLSGYPPGLTHRGDETGMGKLVAHRKVDRRGFSRVGRPDEPDPSSRNLVASYYHRVRRFDHFTVHKIIPHSLRPAEHLLPIHAACGSAAFRSNGERRGRKGMETIYLEAIIGFRRVHPLWSLPGCLSRLRQRANPFASKCNGETRNACMGKSEREKPARRYCIFQRIVGLHHLPRLFTGLPSLH